MSKKKIFIPLLYYLPGEEAGGPVQTIKNFVEKTSKKFSFYIIALNHDINDNTPYNYVTDTWIDNGDYYILYREKHTIKSTYRLIKEINPDFIYLNSFFSYLSIYIVHLSKIGLINNKIILAPRGEFSEGALSQGLMKKRLYFKYSKLFGVYKNIDFQASSKLEFNDIKKQFCTRIKIAMDIPDTTVIDKRLKNLHLDDKSTLDIVFLSRISPMKNLDYALKVLKNVNNKIKFDIYGPIEDNLYFKKCKDINMPDNVTVNYLGTLENNKVKKTLSEYDLFFLPTKGENFGHVIIEALLSGTPILISDRTQWNNLSDFGVGFNVPLENKDKYIEIIENFKADYIPQYRFEEYINSIFDLDKCISDNISLFE